MISLFDREENTVGKGENAGYQHFLLFPRCFPKPFPIGLLKVMIVWWRFNSIPNKKSLDQSRLGVFADEKINATENLKFVLQKGWNENIGEKGENAGFQHFLLFLTVFSIGIFSGLLKVWIVW